MFYGTFYGLQEVNTAKLSEKKERTRKFHLTKPVFL